MNLLGLTFGKHQKKRPILEPLVRHFLVNVSGVLGVYPSARSAEQFWCVYQTGTPAERMSA
jgi:hypothetical protein